MFCVYYIKYTLARFYFSSTQMNLSLEEVISSKQRLGRYSSSSARGRGRGRGRGSIRIGQKEYKTLTIKKSKLAGVDLSVSSSRNDNMKPFVVTSSTPGKRYFSNSESSYQSPRSTSFNNRGIKRRSQSSIQSRIGENTLSRSREDEDNTGQWKRGRGVTRRNRGTVVNLNKTIPRVGSNDRGFKGLASNSKKIRAYSTGYLKSPTNRDLITQHIELSEPTHSKGRGFRGGRGGRVGARGRSSSFNKSFEQEQEEANIQVTFSNPKAASKSTRLTEYGRSSKEPTSSKRISSNTMSDPGEHIFISVQNENARSYVPEGVEIDPSFITHKTSTSLNERFSQGISFEGKERIIQKHSMY